MSKKNDLRSANIKSNTEEQNDLLKIDFDANKFEQESKLSEAVIVNKESEFLHSNNAQSISDIKFELDCDTNTTANILEKVQEIQNTQKPEPNTQNQFNKSNSFNSFENNAIESSNKDKANSSFLNQDHGLTPSREQADYQNKQSDNPYNASQNIDELNYNISGEEENTWYHLSGRIGRVRYLAYNMAIVVLLVPLAMLWFFLLSPIGNVWIELAGIAVIMVIPVVIYANIIYPIRRLHDLNLTGWWCVITFIPYVSLIFYLYLIFASGNDGMNDYGLQPRANRAIHYVLGLLPITIASIILLKLLSLLIW